MKQHAQKILRRDKTKRGKKLQKGFLSALSRCYKTYDELGSEEKKQVIITFTGAFIGGIFGALLGLKK